ncbi:RNA polymerase factor sigma-54 [Arcticibacterium luteifluviistationis]|uniref:RNA polymerase sigma-54 factor n=1 Tax=Arcticibacterium luteifluviistationis TaxID=1784714 RepID=A0A2Z4GB04_9BACT|nr:RNA polymerase factor sigma-54 [Arcticibacterium luteifluviistationis]AWV98324.1 RNA polymerase sigma-54 factor [Arcticibacterium luteifluviistationis]
MQRLSLNQSLQQRLSPQQIQFIKLLQIPTAELDQRIEEELEINPALEEGMEFQEKTKDEEFQSDDYGSDEYGSEYDDYGDDFTDYESLSQEKVDVSDYLNKDDYAGYKMQSDNWDEDRESMPVIAMDSLTESLNQQLGYLKLDEQQTTIGLQLIGSIEDDGYIRRPIRSICNDLAFGQNLYVSEEEVIAVLHKVQLFEPAGIGARNLQECLLLQVERLNGHTIAYDNAKKILESYFDEFTKKHFDTIQRKLDTDHESLKDAITLITRLNPKPGSVGASGATATYLMPDFIVTQDNGKLDIILNSKNAPELRVSRSFSDMLDTYDKSDKKNKQIKETVTFVKQKLDAAKWFIDAIVQRQNTLLRTMEAIVKYQQEFFWEGDESKLKPMILKDIAERIEMDISTVSRVANSKAVQTDFGIYPLKYFFSEGISTDSGEDASSREVKNILKELIDSEPKHAPLSDDKLEKQLKKRGYKIARRTVAKYREQLNIPVARLRKQL